MSRIARAAVVLLVLACGCAPHASTPDRLDRTALDLVTASGGYPARKHVLDLAEEDLVERCMTARGHAYRPFVPPLPAGSDEERIVDLPRRRAEGYGLSPDRSHAPAPNSDDPDYGRALFGDDRHREEVRLPNGSIHSYPTTGCVAESRATLYGDARGWARTALNPETYNNTIRAEVANSPQLRDAEAAWASCMAAAGYRFATPDAAREDIATTYDRTGPTPAARTREITTAVADGECALSADLPLTELRLRRAHAHTLPADQRRDLAELAALHCSAHRNAARVLPRQDAPDC